jgi:hypothetical protein
MVENVQAVPLPVSFPAASRGAAAIAGAADTRVTAGTSGVGAEGRVEACAAIGALIASKLAAAASTRAARLARDRPVRAAEQSDVGAGSQGCFAALFLWLAEIEPVELAMVLIAVLLSTDRDAPGG